MSTTDYKIKSVVISTDGSNEIYFDVEWEGNEIPDYYELRVWESDAPNCLEAYAYADHKQRITVKRHYFLKDWRSKTINKETFLVELGIADYSEEGKLERWEVLVWDFLLLKRFWIKMVVVLILRVRLEKVQRLL